ncbi:MAG: ABC transporter substrate-binding protein [Lachnospiraceae bacterium]|nr:ABC transporter substrate-binding protein [Lachnospiraceae bacterium]
MKKTMKSLLALITTLTLAGSLLSGCGSKENTNPAPETPAPSGEETEAPAAETESSGGTTFGIEPLASKTMIDLAYFSGAEHGLVFYIMDEMGWAEELNIGFNWSYFNAGPAMMEANGSWDVGTAGAAGAVNGIVGYDVNVIGISQYEHILNCFVREDSPIYQAGKGNATEAPEVYGDADSLRGTTWLLPVGTTAQQTLALYLAYFGLTTDDVTMTNMDVGSALAAFRAGEGDGMILWTSTNVTAQEEGFKSVCSCDDVNGVYSTCLLATDNALDTKMDAVTTLFELYFNVEDWMMEHPDEMAKMYFEACEVEGISCTETIAQYTAEVYEGLGIEKALERMTTEVDDPLGLADRQISGGEFDVLDTMDYFVTLGSYTEEDRMKVLENNRITSAVAEAVLEKRQ